MGTSSDLVREWFERVWNNGDASYIDKALCSECELTGLDSETIKSPADFHRFHQMLNSLFSDMTIDINHLIDAGDTFAGVVTVNGTHIATGRPVSSRSSCFGTLREGQIYHVTKTRGLPVSTNPSRGSPFGSNRSRTSRRSCPLIIACSRPVAATIVVAVESHCRLKER